MEFDKTRVYTAVNADELPIGSKCIFADTVKALRKIEPSSRLKYKPFSSVDKAIEAIKKHGGWVRDEGTGHTFLVLGYGKHKEDFSIYIGSEWVPLEYLFIDFVFADDDSPCGELVEKTK